MMRKIRYYLHDNLQVMVAVVCFLLLCIFSLIFHFNSTLNEKHHAFLSARGLLVALNNQVDNEQLEMYSGVIPDAQTFLLEKAKAAESNITIQSFTATQANLNIKTITLAHLISWLELINKGSGMYVERMTIIPADDRVNVNAQVQLSWREKK